MQRGPIPATDFLFYLYGQNFGPGSQVFVDGQPATTTVLSPATVKAEYIFSTGGGGEDIGEDDLPQALSSPSKSSGTITPADSPNGFASSMLLSVATGVLIIALGPFLLLAARKPSSHRSLRHGD